MKTFKIIIFILLGFLILGTIAAIAIPSIVKHRVETSYE